MAPGVVPVPQARLAFGELTGFKVQRETSDPQETSEHLDSKATLESWVFLVLRG